MYILNIKFKPALACSYMSSMFIGSVLERSITVQRPKSVFPECFNHVEEWKDY